MELFSELYGAYFRTVEHILQRGQVTAADIRQIIQAQAFRDSLLFLPQKLLPDTPESWGLLQKAEDGTFRRVTRHAPPQYLTLLQKRWLCTKLSDARMRLFLTDEELTALRTELGDVQPLYLPEVFRYFDIFKDGDPYDDAQYRANFRTVLEAIRLQEVVAVEYCSGKGKMLRGRFLPLKLEYSQKNDKFRIYCCQMRRERVGNAGVLNVGRIRNIRRTGLRMACTGMTARVFASRRCAEPVQVRVSEERNGIERFLVEFASYEKHAERDEAGRSCTVQLWYDTQEETELLIRLLGFGPVVEILSPPAFREQAAQRVQQQYALLQDGE
jgi:predicted DNA-binding transcriptional regulator YafY